jgi:DNA (cytosine-5)-methyltransferase 1
MSGRLVSLFCGCGGFDLGFQHLGLRSLGFDIDKSAILHYRENVSPEAELLDLANVSLDFVSGNQIDVMLAGPPCQGFSTVGKRDPNDERNRLLPLTGELAIRLRPKVLVLENVAAARTGEHARHWFRMDERLRLAGFKTHTVAANAATTGLAQTRRRLFLFAWTTRKEIQFEWPTAATGRLDHVLSGVETKPNHDPKPLIPGTRLYKISQRIGPGQKLSNVRGGTRSVHTWNIPEVFGETTAAECAVLESIMRIRRSERRRAFGDADPVSLERLVKDFGVSTRRLVNSLIRKGYLRHIGRHVDLVHTFNGKPRRFRWDDVASTVDTRFGDPHLFLHPNEHRPFTVREAARIQGFPDTYRFSGVAAEHFRLIGNAVPPAMAKAAATLVSLLIRR